MEGGFERGEGGWCMIKGWGLVVVCVGGGGLICNARVEGSNTRRRSDTSGEDI